MQLASPLPLVVYINKTNMDAIDPKAIEAKHKLS